MVIIIRLIGGKAVERIQIGFRAMRRISVMFQGFAKALLVADAVRGSGRVIFIVQRSRSVRKRGQILQYIS